MERQYYHCDDCGICRVGGRENFFHCPTCEGCFAKSMENNHICVERNLKQNCPVRTGSMTPAHQCRTCRLTIALISTSCRFAGSISLIQLSRIPFCHAVTRYTFTVSSSWSRTPRAWCRHVQSVRRRCVLSLAMSRSSNFSRFVDRLTLSIACQVRNRSGTTRTTGHSWTKRSNGWNCPRSMPGGWQMRSAMTVVRRHGTFLSI